jgi:hypothetical protein
VSVQGTSGLMFKRFLTNNLLFLLWSNQVVVGEHKLNSDDGTEQAVDVKEVRQHESYDE